MGLVDEEKHSEQVTIEGLGYVDDAAGELVHQVITVTPEESKRILRKIDLYIMPLMFGVFGCQYIDKNALGYASVMGIRQDLGLSSGKYSTIGSAFYMGLVASEIPATRLLQYFPLARTTAIAAVAWGTLMTCIAATQNFSSIFAVRFLLGCAESAVWPGFTLMVSRFYRVEEHASRVAIWYSANGFAPLIGASSAYKLSKDAASGGLAIAGWRVVFLIWGLVTVLFGFLMLLFLPNSPLDAWFLSPDERKKAVARKGYRAIGNRKFKWYQVREAVLDPLTWLYSFAAIAQNICNGGTSVFGGLIITSFGYTSQQALIYQMPANAIGGITILFWCFLAGYLKLRCFISALSLSLPLLGGILMYALDPSARWGRLIGYWLTYANAAPIVLLLSMIASNVQGYTKKTFTSGVVVLSYGVGNLIGPYTFTAKSAPTYSSTFAVLISMWSLTIALYLAIWAVYIRENRRRERITSEPSYKNDGDDDLRDLTDRESPSFRYAY